MPKNIVLCSDGTGNSGGKSRGTNVYRLLQAVDKHSTERRQVTFYDDGVGTESFKPLKIVGGAFGHGLSRNVRELYKSLVLNYEPGDAIFLFGFSRGAFTVRLLAGMVCQCGLIDPDGRSPEELDALISKAFSAYKSGSKLRDSAFAEAHRFKDNYGRRGPENFPGKEDPKDIPIKFIGVWDTVDAVGLPFDELTDAFDFLFGFRFRRNDLHRLVEYGYHALSIDDERHSFHPVLWDEDDEESAKSHQTIEQVWFAGAHSNVGGGLPRDQLALVPLNWMIAKARQPCLGDVRLRFHESRLQEYQQDEDVHGKIYESRSGLRVYYRYRPRRIDRLCDQQASFIKPKVKADVRIHSAVMQRISIPGNDYAPTGIPEEYEIVEKPKNAAGQEVVVPAAQAAEQEPVQPTDDAGDQEVIEAVNKAADETLVRSADIPEERDPGSRVALLQQAYASIWWRRVAYFLLLLVTIAFVVSCIVLSKEQYVRGTTLARWLDPLFGLLEWLTPGFLGNWLAGQRDNPGIFLVFCGLFLALFVCSTFLRKRIVSISLDAWRAGLGTETAKAAGGKKPPLVARFNESTYVKQVPGLKRSILPWFTLVVIILAVVIFFSRTLWLGPQWRSAKPQSTTIATSVTEEIPHPIILVGGQSESVDFDTSDPLFTTHVILVPGEKYKFNVESTTQGADQWDWDDRGMQATPAGLVDTWDRFKMAGFIPWRRVVSQPWFKLMGSISRDGKRPFPIGTNTTWTASEVGKLRVFVNDAFYENNHGTARITIHHSPLPDESETSAGALRGKQQSS